MKTMMTMTMTMTVVVAGIAMLLMMLLLAVGSLRRMWMRAWLLARCSVEPAGASPPACARTAARPATASLGRSEDHPHHHSHHHCPPAAGGSFLCQCQPRWCCCCHGRVRQWTEKGCSPSHAARHRASSTPRRARPASARVGRGRGPSTPPDTRETIAGRGWQRVRGEGEGFR